MKIVNSGCCKTKMIGTIEVLLMNKVELRIISQSQKMVGNIQKINKNRKARNQWGTQECMLPEE